MSFAKWVFRLAGIYGVLVLTPMYFLESRISAGSPQPISHPENYYGFIGAALAFQVLFLIISSNPARYRPAMIAAILEKVSFGAAVIPLWLAGRTPGVVAVFSTIDLILGALFLASFLLTRPRRDDQGVAVEAVTTGAR